MIAFSNAISSGALANLYHLDLEENQISDTGMVAFAHAIKPTPANPMGSIGNLEGLYLNNNQISDAGMTAFSSAVTSGSLPALQEVDLDDNPGDSAPVDEALANRDM